jgi:nitrate reductase (cytochrome), electron transfer subunit
MQSRSLPGPATRRRLGMIGAAVLVMAAGIALVNWTRTGPLEAPGYGQSAAGEDTPIPWEADVFRLHPDDLAAGADEMPRRGARLRTLAGFRDLRAFPGAPPRVPHPLSPEEFRTITCNACHQSGGYSARFGAYTPVTPHPEWRNCLQCHAADDGEVGLALQGRLFNGEASDTRRARASAPNFRALDWRTTEWPRVDQRAMSGSPPAIPHALEMRGNCLACHAGPSAVAEIRTTHPERANCRQCHVPATYEVESDVFTRAVRVVGGGR